MFAHRLGRFVLVASAVVVLLSGALPRAQAAPATGTPYEINVVLSQTGQAAFIGKLSVDMFTAFEGAINQSGGINGEPIHFVYSDDQSQPQVARQLVAALVAKNVPVILGPQTAGTCRAVAPLLATGPVSYCLSPGIDPDKNSYMFSTSVATSDAIGVALRYFRERGWNRIARLTTTDATGQFADAAFAKFLALPENKTLTEVASEHYAVGDLSAAAQIARIKDAKPQVVVTWATGTPLGTALRGYADAGLDVPVYVTNSAMNTAQLKDLASVIPKQFYSAAPGYVAHIAQSAGTKRVQDQYYPAIAFAGIHNDYISGISWDPALILVAALRQLGTKATAAQIHDYVEHLAHFEGISGTYDFTDGSQRGLGPADIMVMRYDPNTLNWTAVSAFGGGPRR